MGEAKMADKIEAANDPAKEYGSLEVWNGEKRYVLRNAQGHFVTWRKVGMAEDATANKAIADGGHDFTAHKYRLVEAKKSKGRAFDHENARPTDIENAEINRWTAGGDRLYFNGVLAGTSDMWVDLKNADLRTSGQAAPAIRETDFDMDDDRLLVKIHAAGRHYRFELAIDDDDGMEEPKTESETEDEDEEMDDELESRLDDLGMDI